MSSVPVASGELSRTISSRSLPAAAFSAREPLRAAGAGFGGQITPSQERSRHLKSGALGLRLVARLSHIRPSHFGQLGVSSPAVAASESLDTVRTGASASTSAAAEVWATGAGT